MLDNLSKNDPKAYEKMIKQNLEYGQKEVEKKRKAEKQQFMRVFDEKKHWVTRIVMRINRTKQKVGKGDEDLGIKQKFIMDLNSETKKDGPSGQVDLKKWAKEGKFYINVFQHPAWVQLIG